MLVQSTRLFPAGNPCTHSPVHLLCYPLALCIEKNSVFINAFLANILCTALACFYAVKTKEAQVVLRLLLRSLVTPSSGDKLLRLLCASFFLFLQGTRAFPLLVCGALLRLLIRLGKAHPSLCFAQACYAFFPALACFYAVKTSLFLRSKNKFVFTA